MNFVAVMRQAFIAFYKNKRRANYSVAEETKQEYGNLEAIEYKEIELLLKHLVVLFQDPEKRAMILDFISHMEFDEMLQSKRSQQEEPYNFFKSAGIFSHCDIDPYKLRKEAWRINPIFEIR